MNPTGWRAWYTGGRVFDSATTLITDLPSDGVLVVIVYFAEEWAPGKPYRQIMMGNDTYHFTPSTGVFGHSDDDVETVLERYGTDTIVARGQWVTPQEMQHVTDLATAAEAAP